MNHDIQRIRARISTIEPVERKPQPAHQGPARTNVAAPPPVPRCFAQDPEMTRAWNECKPNPGADPLDGLIACVERQAQERAAEANTTDQQQAKSKEEPNVQFPKLAKIDPTVGSKYPPEVEALAQRALDCLNRGDRKKAVYWLEKSEQLLAKKLRRAADHQLTDC